MEIGQAAGLPSGTVHPILARLEGVGWIESRWEDIDPSDAGRPARRYYRLTPAGAEQVRDALARANRGRSAVHVLRPAGEPS
jgi:PadR family transcriptional regulator, regulatory protein PadR